MYHCRAKHEFIWNLKEKWCLAQQMSVLLPSVISGKTIVDMKPRQGQSSNYSGFLKDKFIHL